MSNENGYTIMMRRMEELHNETFNSILKLADASIARQAEANDISNSLKDFESPMDATIIEQADAWKEVCSYVFRNCTMPDKVATNLEMVMDILKFASKYENEIAEYRQISKYALDIVNSHNLNNSSHSPSMTPFEACGYLLNVGNFSLGQSLSPIEEQAKEILKNQELMNSIILQMYDTTFGVKHD